MGRISFQAPFLSCQSILHKYNFSDHLFVCWYSFGEDFKSWRSKDGLYGSVTVNCCRQVLESLQVNYLKWIITTASEIQETFVTFQNIIVLVQDCLKSSETPSLLSL